MQALLDFIYSGETEVVQDELEEFMALASSLEIKGLEEGPTFIEDEKTIEYNDGEVGGINPLKTKKDQSLSEDLEINAPNEELSDTKIELKASSTVNSFGNKNGKNEANLSEDYFPDQHLSNALMVEMEYDEKVSNLMMKTQNKEMLVMWKCIECPYFSKSKAHVQEHVEIHIEGFSHECKGCKKTYKSKRSLRVHAYICKLSSTKEKIKIGPSLDEYKEKVSELMSKNGGKWECKKCPYSTRIKMHLKDHVETHIQGYRFECNVCDITFSRSKTLRRHNHHVRSAKE